MRRRSGRLGSHGGQLCRRWCWCHRGHHARCHARWPGRWCRNRRVGKFNDRCARAAARLHTQLRAGRVFGLEQRLGSLRHRGQALLVPERSRSRGAHKRAHRGDCVRERLEGTVTRRFWQANHQIVQHAIRGRGRGELKSTPHRDGQPPEEYRLVHLLHQRRQSVQAGLSTIRNHRCGNYMPQVWRAWLGRGRSGGETFRP